MNPLEPLWKWETTAAEARLLIANVPEPNLNFWINGDKKTTNPVMLAAMDNNLELVHICLEHGASVDEEHWYHGSGRSFWDYAQRGEFSSCTEENGLLMHRLAYFYKGVTPFLTAISTRNHVKLLKILRGGEMQMYTPTFYKENQCAQNRLKLGMYQEVRSEDSTKKSTYLLVITSQLNRQFSNTALHYDNMSRGHPRPRPVCKITTELIEKAHCHWSPSRNFLFPQLARKHSMFLLLVGRRLQTINATWLLIMEFAMVRHGKLRYLANVGSRWLRRVL